MATRLFKALKKGFEEAIAHDQGIVMNLIKRTFSTILVSIAFFTNIFLFSMELTPRTQALHSIQQAQQKFEEFKKQQELLYSQSAALLCQVLKNVPESENEKYREVISKNDELIALLNLEKWGLERYPAQTDVPFIEKIRQSQKKVTHVPLLALSAIDSGSELSSSSRTDSSGSRTDSAGSRTDSSQSSKQSKLIRASSNSSEMGSAIISQRIETSFAPAQSLSLRGKSPLRSRSLSVSERPALLKQGEQNAPPQPRPPLLKCKGSNNLKLTFEMPEETSQSLIISPTQEKPLVPLSGSLVVQPSSITIDPVLVLCMRTPSDDQLGQNSASSQADSCFFSGTQLLEMLKNNYSRGMRMPKKESTHARRLALYEKCIVIAEAAVCKFLTSYDKSIKKNKNGKIVYADQEALKKAKETVEQLGEPEDWGFVTLTGDLDMRYLIFYGMWQSIGLRCRVEGDASDAKNTHCTYERWAFKSGPSTFSSNDSTAKDVTNAHKQLINSIELLEISKKIKMGTDPEFFLAFKDSVIKRFEICYDLLWKYLKEMIAKNDSDIDSPKNLFQKCFRQNLITESELKESLVLFDARKRATHVITNETTEQVAKQVVKHCELIEKLCSLIKI